MRQCQVIVLFLLFLIAVMGCTAFKQNPDPISINSDRRKQQSAYHRGTYFYPRRENYRGILNYNRATPVSRILQDTGKRHQLFSHKHPQGLPKVTAAHLRNQQSALNHGIFVPKLPNHYTNLNRKNSIQLRRSNRNFRVRTNFRPRNLPIFEQEEDGAESSHFNVYKGKNTGNIFNTVMSDRKYPMMEPVPGQILYPPTVPMFKSAPLRSENNLSGRQSPARRISHHQTIPFYEHEAITPWTERMSTTTATVRPPYTQVPYLESISTSTPFPQIVYAIPYPMYPENFSLPQSFQNRISDSIQTSSVKPYKTYRAYWNKEDISIKPVYEEQLEFLAATTATPLAQKSTQVDSDDQISPPSYFRNHRIESTTPLTTIVIDTFSTSIGTTEKPNPEDKWPEQSQQVSKKVLSTMQAGFKSCYPLHVYTLSKLMQKRHPKNQNNFDDFNSRGRHSLQDLQFNANSLLNSKEILSEVRSFPNEKDLKETPKRARHVSDIIEAVTVEPNYDWIVMDQGYDPNVIRSPKYSSHYAEAAFTPLSKKSIPKVHQSEAVLGTQILVHR